MVPVKTPGHPSTPVKHLLLALGFSRTGLHNCSWVSAHHAVPQPPAQSKGQLLELHLHGPRLSGTLSLLPLLVEETNSTANQFGGTLEEKAAISLPAHCGLKFSLLWVSSGAQARLLYAFLFCFCEEGLTT